MQINVGKFSQRAHNTTLKLSDSANFTHLCPGLHAAAKFAIFRGLAKNRKNRKLIRR